MVLDSCSWAFLVAKVCMMLPKHGRISGCKIEAVCFNALLPPPVGIFVRQVFKEDSIVKGSVERVAAARMYVPTMDVVRASKKRLMCDAPAGLAAVQSCLGHVVPFLSNCFKDQSPFEIKWYMIVVKWPVKWWVCCMG